MTMLPQIAQEIREFIQGFPREDKIIFNQKLISLNGNNFQQIIPEISRKTPAFVDGGQAEILAAGNFCLSFIRVFAQVFDGNKKIQQEKNEFYLFTKAIWKKEDLYYESKIYPLGEKLINENDLFFSSNHPAFKNGSERAPITKITNIARRFAELSLAAKIKADFVILDGTLEKTFPREERFLEKLSSNTCALAKTSSLSTVSGNSPVILLNKLGPEGCWCYSLDEKTSFVKLHPQAKHVFRFEGNKEVLPYLVKDSTDALFLGYPYGLILTDKFARVSKAEKKSLMIRFLLRAENKEIKDYLHSSNAHEILDNLG